MTLALKDRSSQQYLVFRGLIQVGVAVIGFLGGTSSVVCEEMRFSGLYGVDLCIDVDFVLERNFSPT